VWQSFEILPQVDKFDNFTNAEVGAEDALTKPPACARTIQTPRISIPGGWPTEMNVQRVSALAYKF